MINARAETVADKPAYRAAFRLRRCLIPADGFYEWEPKDRGKLPHYFYAADRSPLALAGLWASWEDPESGDRVRTCTIVTGKPSDVVSPIHDRMPVILEPNDYGLWLDHKVQRIEELSDLFSPAAENILDIVPVSTYVNKAGHEGPQCVAPLQIS